MDEKNWLRSQAGRVRRRLRQGGDPAQAVQATGVAQPAAGEGARVANGDLATLVESPLFDHEWYQSLTGARGDRTELARHYLRTEAEERRSPHPLFNRDWFVEHFKEELEGRDPFLILLRRRKARLPFHPGFNVRHYRGQYPEANLHPHGILGHYMEHRGAGADEPVPAPWWPATSGDLATWTRERTRSHQTRLAASLGEKATAAKVREYAGTPLPPASTTRIDVVLNPGTDADVLRDTLASLVAQSHTAWHLHVRIRPGDEALRAVVEELVPAQRWSSLGGGAERRRLVDAELIDAGTSEWIALVDSGDVLHPERFTRLLAHAVTHEADVMADVMRRTTVQGQTQVVRHGLASGQPSRPLRLSPQRLLFTRTAWAERARHARRTDIGAGHEFALARELAAPAGIAVLPFVGVERDESARTKARYLAAELRPVLDDEALRSWDDVVLRDLLMDLAAEQARPRLADVVSVIIPTHADTLMTMRAVRRVMEVTEESALQVQVIVVDNGLPPEDATLLDTLELQYRSDLEGGADRPFHRVEVLHLDANLGFALGNDLALPLVRGESVIFLNNDTEVMPGWLEPLVESLADPAITGVQSLLRYPGGQIQCAGIVYPPGEGVPYGFLQYHPLEDAQGLNERRFHAATAACLAMRTAEVLTLGGFDPIFANGMEDVDLCMRAERLRGVEGPSFVVREESQVWHHESVAPGRFERHRTNRRIFVARWRGMMPSDDFAQWKSMGFNLIGHRADLINGRDRILSVPRPLVRRHRIMVDEKTPRLRWAIKNPAPAGDLGEQWGDTHFADSLAEALRDLGQEVVIDRRQAWERRSGELDDVSLTLRGLAGYYPMPDHVSLLWVISHPEWVNAAEAIGFDHVFAASTTWSAEQGARWGIDIEPLLQATDQRRFHPDLARPDTGHPVLFVGSSRRQDRQLVRWGVDNNLLLSVYGNQWGDLIDKRFVKAKYLPNVEVGAAYRSAGVVLNDHWEDMRVSGFLSNRLFDATAAGARVITDDVSGLGDLFGRSVQVARSAEDLVRLSTLKDPDAVFGDEAERRAVAHRIATEHNFLARARRMLDVALERHHAQGFHHLQ